MNQRKSATKVLTLTLLHPLQDIAIQSWSFENKSPVRVGRSSDSDAVLYSAVVSRHHLEIIWQGDGWELVSLGVNGTYIGKKRIEQIRLEDGMILRLASSGPRVQIKINSAKSGKKLQQKAIGYPEPPPTSDGEKETVVPEDGMSRHL